jgi:hypothetical protein
LKESITDPIGSWEPRRLVYNAVLELIVIAYFWTGFPASKAKPSPDVVFIVFLLAVVANVAYCAAYIAELFAQASDSRDTWQRMRWIVFATGTVFAGIITRFIAAGMFSGTSALTPCAVSSARRRGSGAGYRP